jgi:hypothetical protein
MKPVYFINSGAGLRRFLRWDGFSLSDAKDYLAVYGPDGWTVAADAEYLTFYNEEGVAGPSVEVGFWMLMETFTVSPNILSDYTMAISGNVRLFEGG